MKIRAGFVSNSSSSSFCIFGAEVEADDLIDAAKKLGFESEEEATEENLDDIYECGEYIAEKLKLDFYDLGESDIYYIGRSYMTLKDDETGKQFKQSVLDKFYTVFPKRIKCDMTEESTSNWNFLIYFSYKSV